METDYEKLREVYESMETDALLQLHSEGTLTEEAYEILEAELEKRSVTIPIGQTIDSEDNEKLRCERKHCGLWVKRFAVIGVMLPIVCLILNFEPTAVMRVCEVCWPTGFILLATDGHFNLAITCISIIANAFIWAGFGWLIGYGTSNRIKN